MPNSETTLTDEFASTMQQLVAEAEKVMPPKTDPLTAQLQRMDEHMVAMRNTDSVNQRLFNSLHQELKEYRDNFLRDSLQKPFIRDLVVLFDDLSTLSSQMQTAS